jgi:orotate phosphoribosyltransferase
LAGNGAVLKGHFLLSSGRHSDHFVQKFRVFEHPRLTQSLGEEIAKRWEGRFDVVASPAVGAIVLGFATALAAGVRMVFAEREEGDLAFRRGFALAPHERTLIVEDVITTGGSAKEVVELVKASGAVPVGIGALLDRVDPARSDDLGAPLESLVRLDVESWSPEECPLCAAGAALNDPGSRRL